MSTIVYGIPTFDDVTIPSPGEPVRIGGGLGQPHTIDGYNLNPNGGVTYTATAVGARVRHILGAALGIAVAGSDVTVTLASAAGVPTSTATAVASLVNTDPGSSALMGAVTTGSGAGVAGTSGWMPLAGSVQGSHRPPDVALTNRTIALFSGLLQAVSQGLTHAVEVFVQTGGVTVRSPPAQAFLSGAGSDHYTYQPTPGDLTLTGPFGALAWHYVYCYDGGSSGLVMEISTTAPDVARQQKGGDATRKFVASFFTNAGGQPSTTGRSWRGEMVLDNDLTFLAPSTGTGAWSMPISMATYVPPHVRTIDINGVLYNIARVAGTHGGGLFQVRRAGSGASPGRVVCRVGDSTWNGVADTTNVSFGSLTLPLDANRQLEWQAYAPVGGHDVQASLAVVGWRE